MITELLFVCLFVGLDFNPTHKVLARRFSHSCLDMSNTIHSTGYESKNTFTTCTGGQVVSTGQAELSSGTS